MILPGGFLDELRARTKLAPLIGRRVRLARSGRELKGCCPFHNEKTPSFYVYDDHFHCFGCGAHGDAIGFVMRSEGASFMEAVERLAAEAGLEVPKPTPEAAEAARREADLSDILAAAAEEFSRRLRLPEGAAGLAYLKQRGLAEATIARFGLGWSGEGRGALLGALGRQGIAPGRLIEAGLAKEGERGPVEYFFNRVVFPIRDRRGRVISFGGRTLGDGQPKYLNGPETPVFSKSRTLYGLDLAREAVRAGARLIVVEGYMDVIALAEAGFGGAVAPLGTALTDQQLAELWRVSPSPVLCLDGDSAGRRATLRAIERALPALAADRGLGVLLLPDGEDPDSFLRKRGRDAVEAALAAARPLDVVLYDLLEEGTVWSRPESREQFRLRLLDAAGRIGERGLASEYRSSWLGRFYAERRDRTQGGPARAGSSGRSGLAARPGMQGRSGALAHPTGPRHPLPPVTEAASDSRRARLLTAILLRHPALLPALEEAFGELRLPDDCARLRESVLAWLADAESLDSPALLAHLTSLGLQNEARDALAVLPVRVAAADAPSYTDLEAEWYEVYGLMNRGKLREQRAEQQRRFADDPTPENQERLIALIRALRRVEHCDIAVEDDL